MGADVGTPQGTTVNPPCEGSIEAIASRLSRRRQALASLRTGAAQATMDASRFPRSATMRGLVSHPGLGLALGMAVAVIGPRRLLTWTLRVLGASGSLMR